MNTCYKIEVQNKNAEKLNRKLDELNLPIYMRKYFTVKIESKAGALNYLGVIVDLLNWFIENKMINRERISDIEPSDFTDIMAEDITLYLKTKEQNGMSPTTLETKGKLERVVAESIMLMFFRDSWKAKLDTIYKYVDENATEQQFLKLNSHFNRLELALGDDNKDLKSLLTPTTMPMWIAVFDKFTTYNIEDSRFIDFLRAYNTELKDKEVDGVSMADFKDQQTKKKATITGKIDLLIKLMNEFLHIGTREVNNTELR